MASGSAKGGGGGVRGTTKAKQRGKKRKQTKPKEIGWQKNGNYFDGLYEYPF